MGLLLMAVFGNLSLLGLTNMALDTAPFGAVRRAVRWPAELGVRLLFFAQGVWWISETGAPASPTEAPIVVSNHSSFIDLALVQRLRGAAVSSSHNKRIPVLGALSRCFQFIFVDRADKDSKRGSMATIERRAADAAHGPWPQTVIFPEGTTTNRSALIDFKLGAFSAGVPVQPVVISYGMFWGVDPSFVNAPPTMAATGLRLLCVPWLPMRFTFLPVMRPSPGEKADVFAQRVRAAMAAALGVPMTSHTFADAQKEAAARRAALTTKQSKAD
jgi:1-acyl-sn-glycerol-3-phosphate acyltransferase